MTRHVSQVRPGSMLIRPRHENAGKDVVQCGIGAFQLIVDAPCIPHPLNPLVFPELHEEGAVRSIRMFGKLEAINYSQGDYALSILILLVGIAAEKIDVRIVDCGTGKHHPMRMERRSCDRCTAVLVQK